MQVFIFISSICPLKTFYIMTALFHYMFMRYLFLHQPPLMGVSHLLTSYILVRYKSLNIYKCFTFFQTFGLQYLWFIILLLMIILHWLLTPKLVSLVFDFGLYIWRKHISTNED